MTPITMFLKYSKIVAIHAWTIIVFQIENNVHWAAEIISALVP